MGLGRLLNYVVLFGSGLISINLPQTNKQFEEYLEYLKFQIVYRQFFFNLRKIF
jgi:hypothetical protein